MQAREAFKFGFLARCVHDRIGPEATKTAAEKAAGLLDGVTGLAGKALHIGIPAALAAPPIAGGLLGYGAAKLTDVGDDDVEAIRDREVMDSYATETSRLKRLLQSRKRRAQAAASRPRLYQQR